MAALNLFFRLLAVYLACIALFDGSTSANQYVLRPLADINPLDTPSGSFPLGFTEFGNELYFAATGPNGRELFKTDGESVVELADINPAGDALPGVGSSLGNTFTEYNGELYFGASDATEIGLYKTNGTSVHRVGNVNPVGIGQPGRALQLGDSLYFQGEDAQGDRELYVTDGESVTKLPEINLAGSSHPGGFFVFNEELFLKATGPEGGELFKTDGLTIEQINDINPSGGSNPAPVSELRGELIFVAQARRGDRELYKTDGNTVTQIAELNTQYEVNPFGFPEGGSNPRGFTLFQDELYFSARDSNGNTYELYKTNGETISLVADLNPPSNGSRPNSFFVYEDELFFFANGTEFYKTDGSDVTLIANLPTGIGNQLIHGDYTPLGENLLFVSSGPEGVELYKTDGSEVTQLTDINPNGSSNPRILAVIDNTLFFQATSATGDGLYWTDGESVDIIVDASELHDPSFSLPPLFFHLNGKFLAVLNGPNGRELFKVVLVPEPTSLTFLFLGAAICSLGTRIRNR